MPNFTDRLPELRQFLPVDVPLKVWRPPIIRDPRRGMKLWSQSDESKKSYVSKPSTMSTDQNTSRMWIRQCLFNVSRSMY